MNPRVNRKSLTRFFSKPMIFKLQQGVLKSNDICVSWSLPKTDLQTNFFKFGKSKFREGWFFFNYLSDYLAVFLLII